MLGAGARRVRRLRERADAGAVRGQARTATSAKAPLGAIATRSGLLNWAVVPSPSRKPRRVPLPARVVVASVAMSTRRMRWLERS